MRIDTLEAYNVPTDLLEIWRNTVGPSLLPVQEMAVKEYGLFSGGNLIVFSPTSSRNRREFDAQIFGRQFQIAIVVYEKLQTLLVAQPNIVQGVGLVIVDELQ